VEYRKNYKLNDLLPKHNRIIPRFHPDLEGHLDGLPSSWKSALQVPGDIGQAVAQIWQPIQELARGMVFRLENITTDMGLVVSDLPEMPAYLLYLCSYRNAEHGWLAGTPAEQGEIQSFEQRFGISPPSSYLSLLQIHNGFFEAERPEIGFLSLKQAYMIKFTDVSTEEKQDVELLAFSMDRVGQVHAYNLNAPSGRKDFRTGIWDNERLQLSQPKSFWSYLKDFSIHSLR